MSESGAALLESHLESLPFLHRGKVRDLYAVGEDKLLVIQTDRLSAFDVILPTPIPGKGQVLTALSLFWFEHEEDADEIELGFGGNNGLAKKGDVTLVMRLIEGEFPNYKQVIPKSSDRKLTIESEPFVRALRRVSLLSAERSRAIKLEIGEGKIVMSSSNPDLGDAQEEFDVDFAGPATTIGFNAKYLLDCLGALAAKEVQFAFRDGDKPVEIRPADDGDTLAVVMPMRL